MMMLTVALVMAVVMISAAPAAFAQAADNYKNVTKQETTVVVGGEPVEGDRRVSSHQVKTSSGNTNSQLDVKESYDNDYKFHSHSNLHNGDAKNTFIKDNS